MGVPPIFFLPSEAGEVSPSYGDGGVLKHAKASDPSVGVRRRHLPSLRKGRKRVYARHTVAETHGAAIAL
jgi:hypothetical protein